MKKISKRQAILNKEYSKLRKEFLKDHPDCQAESIGDGCKWDKPCLATDIHHKKGHGKYFLDKETWLAVGRRCHKVITENYKLAVKKGFSESRHEVVESTTRKG